MWNYFWSKCLRVWCFVSMYRIWILETRLIRPNNQSKATLWVLDTCLIVGLWPLIIILITASLSSKTHNKALEPECVFRLMERDQCWSNQDWCSWLESVFVCLTEELPTGFPWLSHVFWFCWFGSLRNEILQSLKSQRSRAGIPSMRKPASGEITSASVELLL